MLLLPGLLLHYLVWFTTLLTSLLSSMNGLRFPMLQNCINLEEKCDLARFYGFCFYREILLEKYLQYLWPCFSSLVTYAILIEYQFDHLEIYSLHACPSTGFLGFFLCLFTYYLSYSHCELLLLLIFFFSVSFFLSTLYYLLFIFYWWQKGEKYVSI